MASKMLSGSPILLGDNTIPGVRIPKEVEDQLPTVFKACRDFGLDFYPTVVEFLTYDEISEVAAYGGFPVRFPHWQFGMEYEELSKGYEHGMHRIYEMVINCLAAKTQVVSTRGSIPVSEVREGDILFAGNGPRKVVAVVKQPKSKVVSVRLKGTGRDLFCTPHHRWKSLTTSGVRWVKAEDLRPGDKILGGDPYHSFRGHAAKHDWDFSKILEETRANVRHRVQQPLVDGWMTEELAELMGAILGDGSNGVQGRENAVSVVIDKEETDYRNRIDGLFQEVFGLPTCLMDTRDSIYEVAVCSKAVVDFLDHLGISKGCTYKTKRIPWSIWASSSEFRAKFLRGLFDTDGGATDVLHVSCYNHDFACDVQLLLMELGIGATVHRAENEHSSISIVKIQGRVNLFKFRERIGFSIRSKQEDLACLTDTENCVGGGMELPYVQARILEIGRAYGMTTYNQKSLGRSLKRMEKGLVGENALFGFVFRALQAGYTNFAEVLGILSVPLYEVEFVGEAGEVETFDVALDHDDHDFLADGLESHNTNPCYIYCLDSNTLVDNITVVAHALGHNDFFKNNVYFSATNTGMLNKMANHGTRIRNYMAMYGKERVISFIDHLIRLQTLIDPYDAWDKKEYVPPVLVAQKNYRLPRRVDIPEDRNYMDPWINTEKRKQKERDRIVYEEAAEEIGVFGKPTKNIMGWLKDNAPLKPWQQDIASMLYEEAMYFAPQRMTKMANEGWASFIDYKIMAEMGYVSLGQDNHDMGIVEYAAHKMGVLGGKYSMNPYNLGFKLFLDIEERWNKGRFGEEYETCQDIQKKANWDTKANQGHDKVFEVRRCYNDVMMIHEFFTPEFCEKHEFFDWKLYPNGEYRIENRDPESIKQKLIQRYSNGGLPDIRLTDPNHLGRGWLCLEHKWEGRPLYDKYVRHTMTSIYAIWGNLVVLSTKDPDGEEYVYLCESEDPRETVVMTRKHYEAKIANRSDVLLKD